MRVNRIILQPLGLALLLCWTGSLKAQLNRGSIEGIVNDPVGAVVPNVDITITSVERNLQAILRVPAGFLKWYSRFPAGLVAFSLGPMGGDDS